MHKKISIGKLQSFVALGCLLIKNSLASATETNSTPTYRESDQFSLLGDIRIVEPPAIHGVLGRYSMELTAGKARYYNRLGTPSRLEWMGLIDQLGYGIYDQFNHEGEKLFADTCLKALRETAVGTMPLEQWEQSTEEWGRRNEFNPAPIIRGLAWLARTAIANTREEDREAISTQPSYESLSYLTHFAWQSGEGFWGSEYGWKPIRDKPYVYLNNNIGHRRGKPFIHTWLRCYEYLRPSEFGLMKIETQAIVTLDEGSQLVFGGVIYPFDMDTPGHGPAASLRLERIMFGGIGSLGAATTRGGQTYSVMWTRRF